MTPSNSAASAADRVKGNLPDGIQAPGAVEPQASRPSPAGDIHSDGDVLLALTITRNTSDPVASADGICITVASGNEECAWQFEQTRQAFDIVGAFGSFTVDSIVPTSPGAFVTIGRNPTQNIIRSVPVPEPSALSLLGIGFLVAAISRQRRRKKHV